MSLTLASLFDGSGTAPLAASMCGITPVWASEIEPYPIRVTTKRFPNMKHYGSITDIDGAKVDPVDIICGGSPCQDLSVAGKQAGLDGGTRSHLFYEMVRIIKEMRKATDGKKPRYIVWENVPGAFSSNNGYDFMSVLQSFAEIAETDVHVPEPERKANKLVWRYAGEMVGCGWSIAWRTVDAQYWGVPQRRRRIYLVVDLDSERAGEILFERKSLSGNTEPGGETRQGTAAYAESGSYADCYPRIARCLTAEYDSSPCIDRGQNICVYESKSALEENWDKSQVKNALRANASKSDHCVVENASAFMGDQGAKARSIAYCYDGTSPTLKSSPRGSNTVPDVCYCLQGNVIDMADTARCNGKGWKEDVSYTLNTIDRPAVCYTADCQNAVLNTEISGTLQAKPNGGFSYNCINTVIYANSGFSKYEEGCTTLKASGGDCGGGSEMLCVYDACGNGSGKIAPTLTGDHENRVTDYTAISVYPNITGALMANSHPGSYSGQDAYNDMFPVFKENTNYIVRRLTPLECSRLQGFPDCWELYLETPSPTEEDIAFWTEVFETHRKVVSPDVKPKTRNQIIKWLKDPYSDSASYKMWGNGMALPNMLFVVSRIKEMHHHV